MEKFLTTKELQMLSKDKKLQYFNDLKKASLELYNTKRNKNGLGKKLVRQVYPNFRNFDYKFIGEENIPKDGLCLFACNHSNSHDILTAIEVFGELGLNISPLIANDDLNIFTKTLFASCDAVLFDRRIKKEGQLAILEMSSRLINGPAGLIFPEATWNLHPYKAMQDIKLGISNIAAITNYPIIPVIFEYVESPDLCLKEENLYSTCIVRFGKPIYIDPTNSLISQTDKVQSKMEEMRIENWIKLGIEKTPLDEEGIEKYLIHTYLKKFKGLGFIYDSETESKYLLSKNKAPVENEYCLRNGLFVPGVTSKKEGKRLVNTRKF